jgi:hypothetical protein
MLSPVCPPPPLQHLESLLRQVREIVEKHTDSSVLEACACLASALCSDAYTFSARADRPWDLEVKPERRLLVIII